MAHILIVEDEENISRMIAATLEMAGYTCHICADGAKAVEQVDPAVYDLVLLDIMLPGLDGFQVMEQVRSSGVPVIFLSAMQQVGDKVRGLRLGAEDYIAKPFEALELLARVEVVLRRRGGGSQVLTYGPIVQNLDSHTVTLNGQVVPLAPKEFELLRVFLQHQDLALSRERLLSMVWGYEFQGESRTVDIHVQRLRQKLGLSQHLVTLPRIGYRLERHP
ncbi:response regulator transcription factor [Pseudoflavonifractor sp. An85]|uniref:response regulator transcription factor n=1 Tax=Pseudoflavonifractor sp. An85 TaxID=1965661 RepID=UPI000B375458|nr:response regulator transcription factor [Pseudoflavonifractor sp. An85]OUN20137.1 DNA-binding response regulator [Pseudoflavonifractor sp. An85]